jgi:hypothetical protein
MSDKEPEPVAVFRREILGRGQIFWLRSSDELPNETLLYTAPKKEWVGLTKEEMDYIERMTLDKGDAIRLTAVALQEKNGG